MIETLHYPAAFKLHKHIVVFSALVCAVERGALNTTLADMTSASPLRISLSQSALQAWVLGGLRGLLCSLCGLRMCLIWSETKEQK